MFKLYLWTVKEEVEKAAQVIREGGVILYPTDTIWGLGCDPQNEKAIDKIAAIKKRNESKQFIVLVNSEHLLNKYVETVPDLCYDLMDMAERPITIVYPKGIQVSKKILAEDGSIAVRKTNHPFCDALMQKTKCGLISTSANISGQPFPAAFRDIDPQILNQVDYVVNLYRDQKAGVPSQIVKIGLKGELKIIRK
ncbi:MAG: threonylcarbamoyl-AMP synthase [Bacteroidetes bacterium]|nr:threonylcarbamoyl-AMP synthase [Bacteroidota bacterium]